VDDIRGLALSASCFPSKPATPDPQSYTRIRSGKAEHPWSRDSVVFNGDRIAVGQRTDVHVRVDGTVGHGSVYLAPALGRCPGSDIGRHIASRTPPSGDGSYEFRKDIVGRGARAPERFILSVQNGAAVVQWQSGQLLVRALDEQISEVGGAFTVIVDSAARRGIIAVQEGLVTLRTATVAAGQSFTFGPGQAVLPVVVRDAGLDEIQFHSTGVWKDPVSLTSIGRSIQSIPHPGFLGSLPWKRMAVAGLGIGGASFAAWKLWPRPGPPPPLPVKAIVVVTIPL
jgi:hypothetical protein